MLIKDSQRKTLLIGLNLLLFGAVVVLLPACGGDDVALPPRPAPKAPANAGATNQAAEEQKERPVYVYSGDRFKDPFSEIGQSTSYQPDAIFSPSQAKLKALIYSRRIKAAVVQIAGSGSYFVKGSRIIDVMGKQVKGFKARVLPEKVVITGEADDVFELKIREDEEEEKS